MASPRYNFWYVGSFSGSLANGAATTISIQFAQNTEFELHDIRCNSSVDTEAAIRNTGLSVKLSDGGTGQQFTSDYVPRELIFGDMEYGRAGDLPTPAVFSGNTTFVIDVLNTSGATITAIAIVLVGIRTNK